MEGVPNVVLLVKKLTETVLASMGMVAPFKEYFTLQLYRTEAEMKNASM